LYRRTTERFEVVTERCTLRQLRHTGLTYAAEGGANTSTLLSIRGIVERRLKMADFNVFSSVESRHHVVFETADGMRSYTLTGVAIGQLKGTGQQWFRSGTNFSIPIPDLPTGKGLKLVHWAPLVTLNSIANDSTAIDAGWAVDGFRLVDIGPTAIRDWVEVVCDLAVRDTDGFVLRLGYVVHLLGSVADLHS
jgi:hypothetical protein